MTAFQNHILTINGGSSSIKFALFEKPDLNLILKGSIDQIKLPTTTFSVKGSSRIDNFSKSLETKDYKAAVTTLMEWIETRFPNQELSAVGHRLVQGGPSYYKPQIINEKMIHELHELSSFDPQHLPEEIFLIEAFQKFFPNIPQVACFDTSFHRDLPNVAKLLPIPRRYEKEGVRRYGFHGLSYQFLMKELTRLGGESASKGKVILAHLGNGASLAAVQEGSSIDTSMGFTPTSGIPMATRSGDLDPGIVWYLASTHGMGPKEFNQMVNFKSGLLGVSEVSSDIRQLLKIENEDKKAADAIALFCYQIKKTIGSYAAALGGLETLVFSGGIGEHQPLIRSRICEGLQFLGIKLEEKQNLLNAPLISRKGSPVSVRVITTDEEWMIAETVLKLLF